MIAKNKFVNFIRNFSFIYCFLYPIFAFLLYFPPIYFILFFFSKSTNLISFDLQKELVFNLIGFFLHISSLNEDIWNIREIIHYTEVRFIYDIMFLVFLVCLIFLMYFKTSKKKIKFSLKIILFVIHIPLIVIPFFSYFWNNIFHQVLFDNDFWILTPNEISYFLFNELFFVYFLLLWYLLSLFCLFAFHFYLERKDVNNIDHQ